MAKELAIRQANFGAMECPGCKPKIVMLRPWRRPGGVSFFFAVCPHGHIAVETAPGKITAEELQVLRGVLAREPVA